MRLPGGAPRGRKEKRLMQERPRVVVTRTRRAETVAKDFAFARLESMPAASGPLAAYSAKAWEAFGKQTLPDVTQEAWRRTDLRALPLELFRLPAADAYKDLPSVPQELLRHYPLPRGTDQTHALKWRQSSERLIYGVRKSNCGAGMSHVRHAGSTGG